MEHFQVYDSRSNTLLSEDPIYEAKTGRKALEAHLKKINFRGQVKVSASNDVHFKVTPLIIENGVRYYNGMKKALWYQIQPEKLNA